MTKEIDIKHPAHSIPAMNDAWRSRMFSLPRDTDSSKIQARFQNGVLTVSIPKTASKHQTQKVEVKAA